jgi:hypothetical protein
LRIFHLYRSNLYHLEYYHQYKDLDSFLKNCHDFYLLFPIWLLEKNHFDIVIIWRLSDKPKKDIKFKVGEKLYIQKWVQNLSEVFKYSKPDVSFWRGGFQEYDVVTRSNPKFFGLKLYLGAGRRIIPHYGGKYDVILMEDERDMKYHDYKIAPFYKTASPFIFHPNRSKVVRYDLSWPCNFGQIRYKGQEFFIRTISENPELQNLSIIHCGNKPDVGRDLCSKYKVSNIEFKGSISRPLLNDTLNSSKFGLNLSNLQDGCPRVSTEVLMSGTPLIINEETRLLKYYKQFGVVEVNSKNISKKIIGALGNYEKYSEEVNRAIKDELSFDHICEKNLYVWESM